MNRALPIKSKWFWIAFAVFGLLLAVSIVGLSRKGAKPAPFVGTVHLEDGYASFEEMEKVFDFDSKRRGYTDAQQGSLWGQKYEGKKVYWAGYVENFRNLEWKGGVGDIFVAAAEMGAAGGKYILDVKIGDVPVKVILQEESKEQAYKLARGQVAIFQGRLSEWSSWGLTKYTIVDGRIVEAK